MIKNGVLIKSQQNRGRPRLDIAAMLCLVCIAITVILGGCQSNEERASHFKKDIENVQGTLPDQTEGRAEEVASPTPTESKFPSVEENSTSAETSEHESSPEPTVSAFLKPTQKPSEKPEEPAASNVENKKKQIDVKYEKKFAALQKSCKAKVSSLSGEVKTYIEDAKASDKEVTISDLQKNFMAKITAAEAGCDKSFDGILANAKQEYESAGLDPSGLDKWSQMYSQSKNEARRQALAQIIAAWKAGSN